MNDTSPTDARHADGASSRVRLSGLALLAVAAMVSYQPTSVSAQAVWPAQQVTFVVAFAPGGPADIVGRLVADRLQRTWGQSIIIENRGGAGGAIAARQVAKAEPNGYQVLVTTNSYSITPAFSAAAGYVPEKDLRIAAIAATGPNVVAGAANLKADTLKEVMALARTEALSYGTAGPGTTPHLAGERLFKEFGKVDVRHTPFTGSGPVTNALLGGHIPLAVMSLAASVEHVNAGKLKGLAVMSLKRIPQLPNVPTAIEAGYGDGEEATWVCLVLPFATPDAILDKINADTNALMSDKALVERFSQIGMLAVTASRKEAADSAASEAKKWGHVIKTLGIKAE